MGGAWETSAHPPPRPAQAAAPGMLHTDLSTHMVQAPPAARHALPALTLDTLPITAPSAAYLYHKPRGAWLPWGNVARRVNLGIKGAGLEMPRESKDSGEAAWGLDSCWT